MNNQLIEHCKTLLHYLDIEEESDSGRIFRPNQISSCRVMDGIKIEEALSGIEEELKRIHSQ